MQALPRVLVIEDNPADIAAIRLLLNEAGYKYELFQSNTLSEGLRILRETRVDVVLLDLSLHDSLGFTTLKHFIKEQPGIPVIVLTGNNNVVLGDQSVRAGAQDYLVKGEFTGKQLVDTIRYSQQRFKSQFALQRKVNQMQMNEKRFQEVQQLAQLGNWQIDIVTNAMFWSEEMYRILGLPLTQQQHRWSDYLDRVHPEDRAGLESFYESALKSGEMRRYDHRILVSGRMIKYVTIQAKLHFDELTNKIMLFGSIQDITQLKNANTENKVDEADSNAQLPPDSLANPDFKIRTPLHTLASLLQLLEKSKPNAQQKEIIETIKIVVDDLSMEVNAPPDGTVNNVVAQAVNEMNFQWSELVINAEQLFRMKCQNAGIRMAFKQTRQLTGEVSGDYPLIMQLFYCVFKALIPFCDKENGLDIEFQCDKPVGNKLLLRLLVTYYGKPVSFAEGADNGKAPGSVAIVIVKKLLAKLDGRWNLEKKGFRWYVLEIAVPLSIGQTEHKRQVNKPALPLHILLVEDHMLNRVLIGKLLRSWSSQASVDMASNGVEALGKLTEKQYDLIIMDLHMPEKNGIETATAIRARSDVPIIAITAIPSMQEEERCRQAGMNAYLAKPINPEELYARIMEIYDAPR